jgi:hypothetical protein
MQLIFGFIIIFIFSVIFSYFQGFIDFLINLGIFPEKYKNNAGFDIMMIFVLYILFMATSFLVAGVIFVYGSFLDMSLKRRIKKAKKKALREHGTTAPYFYFLEPKAGIFEPIDKLNYVYEISQQYLYEKYQDWDKVDGVLSKLPKIEELKLYDEAREYYGLPDIPKEYGIFNQYTDDELAQRQV